MSNFDDHINKSLDSFWNRMFQFEEALDKANAIDGCNDPMCPVRTIALAGDSDIILEWCDVCAKKSKEVM